MRVLVVLADTDRSDASLCALDLHAGLVALGDDARTVALGPGRRGGLDHVVPILAPSPRSFSAVLQLRREQSWADVVLCFGVVAADVQRRASVRRNVPAVVVVTEDLTGNDRLGRSSVSSLQRAASIVCTDEGTAAAVQCLADRTATRLELGVAVEDIHDLGARRAAARDQLDLGADGPVLWWVGAPGTEIPAGLAAAAERRSWPLIDPVGTDDELVVAASDVAVLGPGAVTGPPRELMRAAATGHALVGPAHVGDGGLVGPDTGVPLGTPQGKSATAEPDWESVLDALGDRRRRADMAEAAHSVMSGTFSPRRTLPPWRVALTRARSTP